MVKSLQFFSPNYELMVLAAAYQQSSLPALYHLTGDGKVKEAMPQTFAYLRLKLF